MRETHQPFIDNHLNSYNMAKITKNFEFDFPLKKTSIRDRKLITETVGILHIEGVAYFNPNASVLDMSERYSCDIDFIKWNGTDIKPLLDVVADITISEIEEEVIRMAARDLFTTQKGRAA
jgi:hypothetical protein